MSDYALEESTGVVLVHRADCPDARAAAERGEPVFTLLGCERPPPDDMKRHSCLEEDE